jgi:hypothetical protein
MRRAIRWSVGVVTIVHGLVHLLGVADRVGWDGAGTTDVGTPMAGIWAGTALLVVVAGVCIIRRRSGWWPIAAVAAAVSQGVIVTEWHAARAGTIANVVLAAAAFYGYKSHGPTSARTRYEQLTDDTLAAANAGAAPGAVVTDADVARLPAAVAAWVRLSGAVGIPHVAGFKARIHGRIRSGPDAPWMPFSGEQVNTFGPSPTRVFLIDATMKGLPVDVLHVYRDGHATMDADVASIVNTVHAEGTEMDVAETVTVLNDLCLLAPAVLVDAPLTWHPVDEHRVGVEFGDAGRMISAELLFDSDGRLVDFVSDDRLRSSPDGRTFTRQRWSTPIDRTLTANGRLLVGSGRGRWHGPEGDFDYIEFHVDDIEYLEHAPGT